MKKYLNILKGVKIPWILVCIMFVVTALDGQLAVKTVSLTADIIDSARNTIELNQLIRYVSFLAATVVIGVGMTWLSGVTYGYIDKGVRIKMLRHILHMPVSFYDEHDGSELSSRIINDCGSASAYFELVVTTFGAIYTSIIVFKNLIAYNTRLGIYSLLIIPVTVVVSIIYGKITYTASKKSVDSSAVTTGYLTERVGALRIIKAYNTQEKEKEKAQAMFQKMFQAEVLSEMALAFAQVGMQVINCVSIIIAFVFGAKLVNEGLLTIGELIAFYSLSGTVGVQLVNLFLSYGGLKSVNGSLREISDLLLLEEERIDGKELGALSGDITFENVSFDYGSKDVLSGIDLTIPFGKVTALLGTNGAGKSTMFKLLQRMYVPTKGNIRIAGEDISEFDLRDWRDHFAVVSQNAPLISGTIRENMCYGVKEDISEERLIEVAKACGIYDFIHSLDKGFDSEISVGSTNLSGGQRQAIAIARAILKDSEFLLLDEATKSLDAVSEQIVQKTLDNLMKGRTTIMIAHSPSAIVNADRIVIMEDGKVSDFGESKELLQRNEYYQSFMRA